jgi:outer membrane lipoprotein-sorting protein
MLIDLLNQRWNAVNGLTATVEIQASEIKSNQGVATDFPSCRGYILMRKPDMLRVVGTYFGVKIFDMAGDGKQFTLYIPSKNKAIEGSYTVNKKSANELENLRPDFFYDAMVVRGLDPDDEYMVTADTDTLEDAKKKHLLLFPEYILSVMRHKEGSHELTPVRVITFHRDDLLPYEQDLYDSKGNLETHVVYSNYIDFGSAKFPSKVMIKRPLEGIQITMTVERVVENVNLRDDQFKIELQEGTQIQKLE